jgi:hypothetical protein
MASSHARESNSTVIPGKLAIAGATRNPGIFKASGLPKDDSDC